MPMQRFKLALNQARMPMVPSWAPRAALVPQLDVASRTAGKVFFGSEENADFDVPQILYGENFVPWSQGVKSVSYATVVDGLPSTTDFDQVFPLRDENENQILFSPSNGKNYILHGSLWAAQPIEAGWAAEAPPLYLSTASTNTPATARVTPAYVDGNTFIAYSNLGLSATNGGATLDADGSIYLWNGTTLQLERQDPQGTTGLIRNLQIPIGKIGGVASSNGYLLVWSGLEVHWAGYDENLGAFDFNVYIDGAISGSGRQIPEDSEGPITAIRGISGGFVIFTNKNAVAAYYNANNLAYPWIFKGISNSGGLEDIELSTREGAPGNLFAYTTGGLQRISLNAAEAFAPDVTDFLGSRNMECFNLATMDFTQGLSTTEFFVKMTYVGFRFFIISYGFFPGTYSFALVYDTALQRWGKLRLAHRDAFLYTGKIETVGLTYSMCLDVTYSDFATTPYADANIQTSGFTYPRQALAFLLKDGTIKLAVMDFREKEDASEAFVVLGRVQLSRSSNTALHGIEVEGLKYDGLEFLRALHMPNGVDVAGYEEGVVREQTARYVEYGIDLLTGKNFGLVVKGTFELSTLIIHASPESSTY